MFTSDRDRTPGHAPLRVVMLGTSTGALGGVAAVQRIILDHWPSGGSHRLTHIATHTDGGPARKLATAGRALVVLAGLLASRAVDVAHIHFSGRASFYRKSVFILLCRAFGVPIIGHAHDGLFPEFYRECGPVRRRYIRAVLNRLDRLIVLSEESQALYAALYRRGEPVVIPNPVPVPFPTDRPPTDRPAGGAGRPVLLSLGWLGPAKGTYDLLSAFPEILKRFPDAELWLGGAGEVETVRRRIANEPWGAQVRLLGWVSGADKEAALRRACIFLLPSYAEGLPMALLEAMAHGLPVIATPVGGIPQAVVDGMTGLLVPPGDVRALERAVLALLGDPERAAALGAAARRRMLERYDVSVVLERIAGLYDHQTAPPRQLAAP